MTSSINPNNIDGNYPVAGQPNNTQGFRDNFTNIKTNFQYAETEIDDLQSKVVVKSALTGTTIDNNMNDNLLYAVKLNDVSYTYLQNAATSGTITLDYSASQYQYITTTGSVSLGFSNWPASGSVGVLNLTINITNVAYTMTLPASVSQGLYGIEGISPGTSGVTNTITFSRTGQFSFKFSTADGGTTITLFDYSRPWNTFDDTLTLLAPDISANSAGALNIVGSSTGAYQPILNTGGMVHITGQDNTASRVTNDAFGSAATAYPISINRRARGTASSPSAVQSGDTLARITASGYGTSGYVLASGNVSTTSIDFLATENFATANAGSSINFYTSPIGAVTKTLSATVTANVSTFPTVLSATGNVVSTGNIYSAGSGTVGYNTGAGGTVSQSGNKAGGVTLNKPSGEITMQNTALGSDTSVSFTFTNSTIGARDLLLLNIVGGVTTPGTYNLDANCTTGSAVITVRNITAGSLSEAIVLRYAVIRGSIA